MKRIVLKFVPLTHNASKSYGQTCNYHDDSADTCVVNAKTHFEEQRGGLGCVKIPG